MSDGSFYPAPYPKTRKVGDTWSVKKIIEQVTGQRLEDLQEEKKAHPVRATPPPTLPLFLPGTRHEEEPSHGPALDTGRSVRMVHVVTGSRRRSTDRELERKYLAYLMLHMETLTEPALKYLRQAVEEELKQRGMEPGESS